MSKRQRTSSRPFVTERKVDDGNSKNIYVNQKAKTGKLSDISNVLLKRLFFPKMSIYHNMHYPYYLTCDDSPWRALVDFRAFVEDAKVTGRRPLGVLTAANSEVANTSSGRQVLVQFPVLSQMEFCTYHAKSNMDEQNSRFYNGGVSAAIDDTVHDLENPASPWFRYRSLFLEKHETTFRFTNSSNSPVSIEIMTWKPKTDILESNFYSSDSISPQRNSNNTVLGCLQQDLYDGPEEDQFANTNTVAPFESTPIKALVSLDQQDCTLRLTGNRPKLNKLYSCLHKKIYLVAPGDTITYNVSIPSQMLTNNTANMQQVTRDVIAGTTYLQSAGVCWRPFSRFVTVRAFGRAIIDGGVTTAGINNGAATYADVKISVSKSSYISYRKVPIVSRPTFMSVLTGVNHNGEATAPAQFVDTVGAANQKIIEADDDEDFVAVI